MTIGTHVVPVLIYAGPVKRVGVIDLLIGVKMKPALSALARWPAVPSYPEGLEPPAREFDQILLEGIHPKRVLYFVLAELTVRPVRLDQEPVILLIEPGLPAGLLAGRIISALYDRDSLLV